MTDYYVAFYGYTRDRNGALRQDDTPTIESMAFDNIGDAMINFNDYHEECDFAYLLEVGENSVLKLNWEF